jgi:hypothetical protein
MPKKFELVLKAEGMTDRKISGELTEDEEVMLQCFLDQYKQLSESKPVREGFPCSINVSGEHDKPIVTKAELPDEDTLSILLHRLRPFILQKEPYSYLRVSSIIGRRLRDPYIAQFLREQREIYDGRNSQKQMKIISNDMIINSEKILYDWLNSHEYHRDPDKREVISTLLKALPGELMRVLMVSLLVDKVKAISNLAWFVSVLLGKDEMIKMNIFNLDKKHLETDT